MVEEWGVILVRFHVKKRGTVHQIDTFRKPYTEYFPDVGARVYRESRKNCGAYSRVKDAWEFIDFAEDKILKEKWSPDAAVGYPKRQQMFEYIPSKKPRKHKRVLETSIEERPESIEKREDFGHREIDTVLSRKSNDHTLLTLVERKTRHKIIRRIPSKTAPAVTDDLQDVFGEFSEVQNTFKTITADNGSEFSELSNQGKEYQINVCFARPYTS